MCHVEAGCHLMSGCFSFRLAGTSWGWQIWLQREAIQRVTHGALPFPWQRFPPLVWIQPRSCNHLVDWASCQIWISSSKLNTNQDVLEANIIFVNNLPASCTLNKKSLSWDDIKRGGLGWGRSQVSVSIWQRMNLSKLWLQLATVEQGATVSESGDSVPSQEKLPGECSGLGMKCPTGLWFGACLQAHSIVLKATEQCFSTCGLRPC